MPATIGRAEARLLNTAPEGRSFASAVFCTAFSLSSVKKEDSVGTEKGGAGEAKAADKAGATGEAEEAGEAGAWKVCALGAEKGGAEKAGGEKEDGADGAPKVFVLGGSGWRAGWLTGSENGSENG